MPRTIAAALLFIALASPAAAQSGFDEQAGWTSVRGTLRHEATGLTCPPRLGPLTRSYFFSKPDRNVCVYEPPCKNTPATCRIVVATLFTTPLPTQRDVMFEEMAVGSQVASQGGGPDLNGPALRFATIKIAGETGGFGTWQVSKAASPAYVMSGYPTKEEALAKVVIRDAVAANRRQR